MNSGRFRFQKIQEPIRVHISIIEDFFEELIHPEDILEDEAEALLIRQCIRLLSMFFEQLKESGIVVVQNDR